MACEFYCAKESRHAAAILGAMQKAAGGVQTRTYAGRHRWLMLWGAGHPAHAEAAERHIASGGPVVQWDLGYTAGHYRMAVNGWHPSVAQIEATPPDQKRWESLRIPIWDSGNPSGPIVLVGLGPKSKRFLGDHDWERRKLAELRKRFPGRQIVFRPKPGRPFPDLKLPILGGPIQDAIKGASLVVCRHSNVAVDAAIAGVPFECEDGAAMWLTDFSRREEFLHRLAWWQWRPDEAEQAWAFIRTMA